MCNQTVAATILRQLGGQSRLCAMLGVRRFLASDNSVNFKFTNPKRTKPNCVTITLEDSDTYSLQFHRVARNGLSVVDKGHFDFIYADQLVALFEGTTGLDIHL